MTVSDLLAGVLEETRRRIRNGEATERGLARRAGLSQPHVHNVLKGVRVLSPGSADRIMQALSFSVADVIPHRPEYHECPVCGHPSEAGQTSSARPDAQDLAAAASVLSRELTARTRRGSSPAQGRPALRPTSR